MQGHMHDLNSDLNVIQYPGRTKGLLADILYEGYTQFPFSVGLPTDDGVNGIPRTGHTTEPQSLGVNFIIKY
jgi:hypothetical protein